ncbi:caspase family protein [Terasakiella sp.]|uniref:WD40 domain-containing protein n=1 Tax=Terasakiella sp. TaxID=2034861 RepID=UPI003AA992EF
MISRRKFLTSTAITTAGAVLASNAALAQFMPPSVITQTVTSTITDAINSSLSLVVNAHATVDLKQVTAINAITSAKVSGTRDKKHMLKAHDDGSVTIWDLDQGRQVKKVDNLHQAPVTTIAMSEHNATALSAAEDGSLSVINANSGQAKGSWKPQSSTKPTAVAVANKSSKAAVAMEDGSLVIVDTDKPEQAVQTKVSKGQLKAVSLSNDGKTVLAGRNDGKITIVDSTSNKAVKTVKAHKSEVTHIQALKDDSGYITTSSDGTVKKWNADFSKTVSEVNTGAPVTQANVSDDGTKVATASPDGQVKINDINTKTTIAELKNTEEVKSVEFGTSNNVVHVASKDGTSRILDANKGKETARVVVTKQDGWAALDVETGGFEGDGDALTAVKWENADMSLDMDQFGESHMEPGVLALASASEAPTTVQERPKLSVSFATPPEVAIASPSSDEDTDEDEFEVSVQAADLGGGVKEIRLYQNGKLVAKHMPDEGDAEDKVYSHDFEIKLAPGKNDLRCVALSKDAIESKPAKVKIAYSGAELKSVLHVAAIGINDYRNPALSLNYGVPDATGIKDFFEKQPKKLFKDIRTTAVFDKQATKSGIKAALMSIKDDAKPEDVVLIYLAGHGDTLGESWYFMPYDVTYPERPDHVREKGIPSSELEAWVAEIPAQKVVMLMDSCKSGAAVAKTRGFEERKALSRLSRTSGIHVIAGAAKEQFAVELTDLGHGAFTYTILEALNGGGINPRKNDGLVSVRGLSRFIEDRLPELSEEGGREPQFPVISSRGQDFPLAVKV